MPRNTVVISGERMPFGVGGMTPRQFAVQAIPRPPTVKGLGGQERVYRAAPIRVRRPTAPRQEAGQRLSPCGRPSSDGRALAGVAVLLHPMLQNTPGSVLSSLGSTSRTIATMVPFDASVANWLKQLLSPARPRRRIPPRRRMSPRDRTGTIRRASVGEAV